mmetsp:Transcript_2723/g.3679  ORF Transcript_2723/g.3679 Transcript_2723/m.3679 type:complete len:305 (+) Transcript_2723:126-1040(+)
MMFSTHNHYHVEVRRRLFYDETPLKVCGDYDIYINTFLKYSENLKQESEREFIKEFKDTCSEYGGNVTYVGKVARPIIDSVQIPDVSKDDPKPTLHFVVLSAWDSKNDFLKLRMEYISTSKIWVKEISQGLRRSGIKNLLIPQVVAFLGYVSGKIDIIEPANEPKGEEAVEVHYHGETKGEVYKKVNQIAKAIGDDGPSDEPLLMWNWLQESKIKKERDADNAYGLKMMKMLGQNGGGIIHMFDTVQLSDDNNDGVFDRVVAVHYPHRKFMSTLLRSQWMFDTTKGKSPGDTLACLTVPFSMAK